MNKILTLSIFLLTFSTLAYSADPEKARIVTHKSNPVKCLAAIAINQVDGKMRQLPNMGFEIEPGEHTMSGLSTIDLKNCPPAESSSRKPSHIQALDWYFEAGHVYYVALDYSNPNRENWRVVVWKAEGPDGEVIFDITTNTSDTTH